MFMCPPSQRVSMRFSLSKRLSLLHVSCTVQELLVPLLDRLCTDTVFSSQALATTAACPSDSDLLTNPREDRRQVLGLFFIARGEIRQ